MIIIIFKIIKVIMFNSFIFNYSTNFNSLFARLKINWVSFRCCLLIFFPYLNAFITFSCNHSQWTLIKHQFKYSCFTRQRSRLNSSLNLLKVVPTSPIKEIKWPIITTTSQYVISVYCYWVYHSIMIRDSSQLFSIWTFPNSNFIWSSWSKSVLFRMNC